MVNIERVQHIQDSKVKMELNTNEMSKIEKLVYRNGVIKAMEQSKTTKQFVESLSDDLNESIDMYVDFCIDKDMREEKLRLEEETINKASLVEESIKQKRDYEIAKNTFISSNYDSIEIGLLSEEEKDTLYRSYLIQEQKKKTKKLEDRDRIEKLKRWDMAKREKIGQNNFEEVAKKNKVFYKESDNEALNELYKTFKVEKLHKYK